MRAVAIAVVVGIVAVGVVVWRYRRTNRWPPDHVTVHEYQTPSREDWLTVPADRPMEDDPV